MGAAISSRLPRASSCPASSRLTDMTGDPPDIVGRLKAVLPARWFPDQTPVLDTVLTGLSTGWSSLYALLATVRLQSRIATATGQFLDGASADFFAGRLPRRNTETDDVFRLRIKQQLAREHATRAAVAAVITDLTGHAPIIFEAGRVSDTGGYATGGFAYGTAGAWGSLNLPFQVFVTAKRAQGVGIAEIAGYGTPGPLARASLAAAAGQVTDADIYTAIASVMPTATRAWTRITN
jgi:hypothetical protein